MTTSGGAATSFQSGDKSANPVELTTTKPAHSPSMVNADLESDDSNSDSESEAEKNENVNVARERLMAALVPIPVSSGLNLVLITLLKH